MTDFPIDAINAMAKTQRLDTSLQGLIDQAFDGSSHITLQNDVVLETIKEDTKVDLHYIHCSKTGQPVARLNDNEIQHLLSFYSVRELTEIADKLELASSISRVWLRTDPASLDKLEAVDPRGFFCYCVNIILQNHHLRYVNNKRQFATIEAQTTFRNSLVRSWYQTEAFTAAELAEANKHLRVFIYLDLHRTHVVTLPWQHIRDGVPKPNEIRRAYDPNIAPLLPHEFATHDGIAWLKKHLPRLIEQARRQLDYNNANFDRFVYNSAFRQSRFYSSIAEEFNALVQGIEILQRSMTIKELVAKSKAINDAKRGVVVNGLIKGAVALKIAAKAPTPMQPAIATKPAIKPFVMGKLPSTKKE